MPSLVRTLDRHSTPESRTPAVKPFSDPDLQVAGLQEHATNSQSRVVTDFNIDNGLTFIFKNDFGRPKGTFQHENDNNHSYFEKVLKN